MSDAICVLHVDDEPGFAEMAGEFLEREDNRFTVYTATSPTEGLEQLRDADVDCIVSDHDMPEQTGIEFLKTIRKGHTDLPFILFTGKGSEAIASDAISAGVTDYLQKEGGTSQYTVLANRIINAVEQSRTRQEVEETEQKLTHLAEKSDDVLFMFDAEWNNTLFVNSAFKDIWGVPVSEVESDPTAFLEAIHPEDQSNVRRAMEGVSNGENLEVEYRVIRPNGDQRWVRADSKPIFDDDGNVTRIVGFVRDITDQKAHERELREERAFIEQTLDALQDVFFVFSEDLEMQRWNDQILDVTGYSANTVANMGPTEFFPEDHQDRIANAVQEVLETGTATVQAEVLTTDGERIPYEFVVTRLVDPSGEVLGFAGVGRDITEQNAREAELERARDLLEKTERIADVGGWEIDTDTADVYWTDHLFELLGVDYAEEPPLDEALDVYHEADRPIVENAIDEACESGTAFDVNVRFLRPDGEIRWLRLQGVPTVKDGDVISLRGAVQDITDHREREQALEQARQDYEELFNGMNDTAWVLTTDGEFLAANDAAVETTGYSRDELLSMGPFEIDVALDEDEIMTLLREMPEDKIQVVETVHETKAGRQIPVEISSSLISYRGETAVLSIARDISDRKRREEQLEEFASVVSHDLRNPLTVAQGRLKLAQEECDSEHLDEVAEAHRRMDRLIENLLTLARKGTNVGDQDPVELAGLVETSWQHVATADATLQTEIDQTILADRSRLQQLLENVMRNAVEHGGDDVTITVGSLDNGFYIEDDGRGIPQEQHQNIFEMGYSTSAEGTGLGLSIAKEVADAHGWQIQLEDGASGGPRFEISGIDVVSTPSVR